MDNFAKEFSQALVVSSQENQEETNWELIWESIVYYGYILIQFIVL